MTKLLVSCDLKLILLYIQHAFRYSSQFVFGHKHIDIPIHIQLCWAHYILFNTFHMSLLWPVLSISVKCTTEDTFLMNTSNVNLFLVFQNRFLCTVCTVNLPNQLWGFCIQVQEKNTIQISYNIFDVFASSVSLHSPSSEVSIIHILKCLHIIYSYS